MNNIRKTTAPELRFAYDDSVEKALEIDGLLDDLASKGEFLTEEEKLKQMTLDDLNPPPELIRGLREAKSIWVVPHRNPDPDAIGSALAGYTDLFTDLGYTGIGCAALLMLATPLLKKMMHGIH